MKQERTIDDQIRQQSQFMSLALVVTPEPHRRALSQVGNSQLRRGRKRIGSDNRVSPILGVCFPP